MILLDTNILIRWASYPDELSKKVKLEIASAQKSREIIISSISVWEICLLIKQKRLKLSMNLESWLEIIENLPYVQFVPVDNKIVTRSVFLNDKFHKDPADRIIVATAQIYGAKLVTSDKKIIKYKEVATIW